MGMFDSIYDANGNEWQTKAFDRELVTYRIGDALPAPFSEYQVEVFGGPARPSVDSHATIRDGSLAKVPDERDETLPLLDYFGGWVAASKGD